MFYSEAILSKKGPLAKVWLAAHWERKLSKTQFLQTNIQSSVGAILGGDQPPMALRLSGQLLLGVVRIYSRKARYLLEDCNEALVKIKLAFRPGIVDMPEEQVSANYNSITLPDIITEIDILLPEPEFNLSALEDQAQVTTTSNNNTSRPQDITIRDSLDVSTDLGIGADLLDQALDIEDGRGYDLDFEADFDPKTTGMDLDFDLGSQHGSVHAEGSMEIEVARDAPPEHSITMEDVGGVPILDLDKDLLLPDGGPELDLGIDKDLLNLDEGNDARRPEVEVETEMMNLNLDDRDQATANTIDTTNLDNSMNLIEELPENEEFRFQTLEPQVQRTHTRRKRRFIIDDVTELPNELIAKQIKDTSDIVVQPSFLPASRKSIRLAEIRQLGPKYYLDMTAPPNTLPELHCLFTRKRPRVESNLQEEPQQQDPSVEQSNLDDQEIPINDDFIGDDDFGTKSPIPNDTENKSSSPVNAGPEDQDTALQLETTDDTFPQNLDSVSPDVLSEEGSTPRGLAIFDQEDMQDQAGISKNTMKAMRLLQREFDKLESDSTGSSRKRKAFVSYETVVGKSKRQDAVKLFFELLVLKTKDVIDVQQKKPFGDVEIRAKDKLFETFAL